MHEASYTPETLQFCKYTVHIGKVQNDANYDGKNQNWLHGYTDVGLDSILYTYFWDKPPKTKGQIML